MTELTEQQVRAALHGLLEERSHATFEGSGNQSYLHVPYREADAAVLARLAPKLIGPSDDVAIDRDNNMLHFSFTVPEGYDEAPPTNVTLAQIEARVRELRNNPAEYERALRESMQERDEPPTPYGQRAANDFFQRVELHMNNPRALIASVNMSESGKASYEACMEQYTDANPNRTLGDEIKASNACRVSSRSTGAER